MSSERSAQEQATLTEDAEAEAVLMALGSQLEWAKQDPSYPDFHQAILGTKIYSVELLKRRKTFRPVFCDNSVQIRPGVSPLFYGHKKYQSVEAAKSACERHHATGKWE